MPQGDDLPAPAADTPVQVAFCSGSEDLHSTLIEKMHAIGGGLPLYIVSEFAVEGGTWIPFHPRRTLHQNRALLQAALSGKRVARAGLILQPRMPYWGMRRLAVETGGLNSVFFNENLDHFMLRPRSLPTILRHLLWRTRNFVKWELQPGGTVYTFLWRLRHPKALERPILVWQARRAGRKIAALKHPGQPKPVPSEGLPEGISVVVPSRDGRELLERLLPGLERELAGRPHEILISDNGSTDGTAEWLRGRSNVRVLHSARPLSFAEAVNRGIAEAGLSCILLINNDMVIEPFFFDALCEAFRRVPGLFCATAQIFFPPGVRREETGKAVMPPVCPPEDFPVTCTEPIPGEDHTWVLYGSGGCSMYDTARLRELGGMGEQFQPAYVEDLDLGFRAWQRGWPTVFVAGAKVEHRHRATTSRYYTEEQLAEVLERNYLKFVAGATATRAGFERLWSQAIERLNVRAARQIPDPAAMAALRDARGAPEWHKPGTSVWPESRILAAGSGEIAVFPGRKDGPGDRPVVLVASPYLPFPLSHGGAVRMYNLMRRAAQDYRQVLICFAPELEPVPAEMKAICEEIVLVRLRGAHSRPLTDRPDVVEEFDSEAFRAALDLAASKWRPGILQLEFTQMGQYADACRPARTILVEHDVTLDLYGQLLARQEDWEVRQQFERWDRFERQAWERVDRVVVMSDKDRATVGRASATVLINGVDLERFTPATEEPEPARVLFIGSFAHLPNVLAVDFFLREVWPAVLDQIPGAVFHVIAGKQHEYFLDRYRDRVQPPLSAPGVEVDGFVSDPRAAYRRAAAVAAPLLASAGTNIKIMEAMAMGKAVVSTPGGVNGLDDLRDGWDVAIAAGGPEMAARLVELLRDPAKRHAMEAAARQTVERRYGWDAVAARQRELYEDLLSC